MDFHCDEITSNNISKKEIDIVLNRFPMFELPYETNLNNNQEKKNKNRYFASQQDAIVKQNKILENYDVSLAIPVGKKFYAWFTFYENTNVCYLFELDRKKNFSPTRIKKISSIPLNEPNNQFHSSLSLGTIVYGTICDKVDYEYKDSNILQEKIKWFIMEDIISYHNISMKSLKLCDRLCIIKQFLDNIHFCSINPQQSEIYLFRLPVIQKNQSICNHDAINIKNVLYSIHHIQFRCSNEIKPYMNVDISSYVKEQQLVMSKNHIIIENNNLVKPILSNARFLASFNKPQYKYKTVFIVKAEPQYDIYNLYAYGKNKQMIFYNIAYIPNYKTSVFMNNLFRNIKENKNLDYIEESDDEEDFQNVDEYKYVDVKKQLLIECAFHPKFKKWIPLRVVDPRTNVIHIQKL